VTRGRSAQPFDRSIDVQLSRLRRKIEADPKEPRLIKTVRGGGYVLSCKVARS
jgi:two-component system OmpR family response regulator